LCCPLVRCDLSTAGERVLLTEKELEVMRLRKADLTQVEVAKKLGISQAAVSSFEKNALRKTSEAAEIIRVAGKFSPRNKKTGGAANGGN
jgi:transcriptional regulator